MSELVVTRHPALVDYLREEGIIPARRDEFADYLQNQGIIPVSYDEVEVISHATEDDVAGRDVIGVLPLRLAAEAKSITEVPMNVPPELRGQELTIDQIREYAGSATTYRVEQV